LVAIAGEGTGGGPAEFGPNPKVTDLTIADGLGYPDRKPDGATKVPVVRG
jgi:hypothetical protein